MRTKIWWYLLTTGKLWLRSVCRLFKLTSVAAAIALMVTASMALGQTSTTGGGENDGFIEMGCSLNQWRFVAYGDQSISPSATQLVAQILLRHEPAACYPIQLVAHAGDASYIDPNSTDRLWWSGTIAPLRALPLGNKGLNYVLALGNHDQDTPQIKAWYLSNVLNPLLNQRDWPTWQCEPGDGPDRCERLIYAYSYRNAHFIVADLDGGGDPYGKRDARVGPRALNWIARDIERAKRSNGGCRNNNGEPVPCDWIFYLSHPPCYSLMGPIGDSYFGHGDDTANCTPLEPILAQGVDLVIQGHTHQYYRTFPMLPGNHGDPQPKCGTNCPDEDYTGRDIAGAPIYLTVGTGGAEIYPNFEDVWGDNRERLNAYAAAFPAAGGQTRDTGTYADGGIIVRVPPEGSGDAIFGVPIFTINGPCLLMEYISDQGEVYDRFTINKNGKTCDF